MWSRRRASTVDALGLKGALEPSDSQYQRCDLYDVVHFLVAIAVMPVSRIFFSS